MIKLIVLAVLGAALAEDVNVATSGTADQSSIGWNGAASRGIDGYTNQYWSGASCTHSKYTYDNWWKVDLLGKDDDVIYHIQKVVIYNRKDCCSARIGGAKVWVGDFDYLCGTVDYENGKSVYEISCDGAEGNTITISQDDNYLTLCEVEVYVPEEDVPSDDDLSTYTNILEVTTGEATQSSVGWNGVPERAIDGDTNGQWSGSTCTHTKYTSGWWNVDFTFEYEIDHVVIYNRQDCCQNRINGAKVYVGDTLCGAVAYKYGKNVYKVDCDGAIGSNVKITTANQYLTLCEVEVMVKDKDEEGSEEVDPSEELEVY